MAGLDWSSLGVILLASGESRRMGSNKLLLPVDETGKSCVRAVAETLAALGAGRLVAVYKDERVLAELRGLEFECRFNPRAEAGQSEAIKLGLRQTWPETVTYWTFVMGDQPRLSAGVLKRLLEALSDPANSEATAAVPVVEGVRYAPAVFKTCWREALLTLEGDRGAKGLLKQAGKSVLEVVFDDAGPFLDLDTPEAYAAFKNEQNSGGAY